MLLCRSGCSIFVLLFGLLPLLGASLENETPKLSLHTSILPLAGGVRHASGPGLNGSGSAERQPVYLRQVLQIEDEQRRNQRHLCPSDRLVVVEAAPGFENLLFSLQTGLTLGTFRSSCV
jgi:hypothetical protein